jgi:hypothetical protein
VRARLALLGFGLFWCCGAARVARADASVDTADQGRGVAPRIELEVGPAFAIGLGHACRENPVAEASAAVPTETPAETAMMPSGPTQACSSAFGSLGVQALLLFRPFNHWAVGPRFMYDGVLGSHRAYVDGKGTQAGYGRHAVHLAAQLRWYSRSVKPGGFFAAAHAGLVWWTDRLDRVAEDGVTRSAPELGLELGGLFAPYRGPGLTMGVQSVVTLFPQDPAAKNAASGSTYDYSPFVFLGFFARAEVGLGF